MATLIFIEIPAAKLQHIVVISDLGILFIHHEVNRVVQNNLDSIRRHNPDATIATISAGEPLPDGYTMEATPRLKQLHTWLPNCSSDRIVCSWFLQRRETCKKWWLVEWDTFCATSVHHYYQPVWDFHFVATAVRMIRREAGWSWFTVIKTAPVPKGYRPFIMGAVPFCYLVSEEALKATCTMLIENELLLGNGELRFSTAANRCGFLPCGFSPPDDQITWINWLKMPDKPTIVHPVKFFYEEAGR